MSEQSSFGQAKEVLSCTTVDGFDSLAELALDTRSSWMMPLTNRGGNWIRRFGNGPKKAQW
jgi:hypothetical protein